MPLHGGKVCAFVVTGHGCTIAAPENESVYNENVIASSEGKDSVDRPNNAENNEYPEWGILNSFDNFCNSMLELFVENLISTT